MGELLPGLRVFVERVRRTASAFRCGRRDLRCSRATSSRSPAGAVSVGQLNPLLPEVEDQELLDLPAEIVDVFVTNREPGRRTLGEAASEPWARGVYLRKITRAGRAAAQSAGTGSCAATCSPSSAARPHIAAAVPHIGTATRASEATDMVTVGLGIVVGALIGIPAFHIGALEIGLSASVGTLLGGLILGWARSLHPTFGNVPGPALWFFESVGLAGFVAVTGLAAGPDFVRGLQEAGLGLLLAAFVAASCRTR